MLFSLYPTDNRQTWERVVDLADHYGEKEIFCSLHIPEAKDLQVFLSYLKEIHEGKGYYFMADVSPATFQMLSISMDTLNTLFQYGITGLRMDYGFSDEEIGKIAGYGFRIAINASTAQEETIKHLAKYGIVGWHNYYPRPETGISIPYFESQNKLFRKYGLAIYTFIPGEALLRAPLFMGLPVMEEQRFQNSYVNFVEMAKLDGAMKVCVAEGILSKRHLAWIKEYEETGILTIPLCSFDELSQKLHGKTFPIRMEETNVSWRLGETRKLLSSPQEILNGEMRKRGSLQMDTEGYGRYEGEIHIMKKDCPLNPNVVRVADIPSPYIKLVDFLGGRQKIRFEKI